MTGGLVDPAGIPDFTGSFEQLHEDVTALRADARAVRSTGTGVHTTFQGLSACYTAPEARQLFASTQSVAERADGFADDLEAVSGALHDFVRQARPLVERLRRLKEEAAEFVTSVSGDDEWAYDEDRVGRNADLIRQVSATVAEFWAAEREAANRISALTGGPVWRADDGTGGEYTHGLSAEVMRGLEETPWGVPTEREHGCE
ncbi:hypothetical protein V1J52_22470 [Streptomyces sp. TRM 70351]|uniref:hypothetical protein n=1 Tax=Streptomyces sp. TRM 70351 TaxID=3116552 RepID=UPI002E7ADA5F|nr:hypothetical protein [Streptomyces sp. TRM 70351]MEE1930910.1 hypothetical protein [Streptomyces sp. TRM 70351]